MTARPQVDVVIPTSGRPSLAPLLDALEGFAQGEVIVIEDRAGRGPAWARNAGWRRSRARWIAFLDDDVIPEPGWAAALARDLHDLSPRVGASQGRLRVPLPSNRRPTDWERNVAGLERARWATADMAFRRAALEDAGGFDERFPRAYREDADLGLRLTAAGWEIVRGERRVRHPVGPAGRWVSVGKQAGNADDALMRRLHGRGWRERAGAPRGALPAHAATVALGALALVPRTRWIGAAGWLAATARFAWRRIAPGPRTAGEAATMLVTSAAIPPAAVGHRLRGELRVRRIARRPSPAANRPLRGELRARWIARRPSPAANRRPAAVLLDRDGTLVVDVPYNGDPERVVPTPTAQRALDRLRGAGVPLAVVSNQSGIARGLLDRGQVEAVNRRVEELLGPIGPVLICPHGPEEGCACRKPQPGLVLAAARALGVEPSRCAVIGDIGADVQAARAAGARAVLVPTAVTRREEIAAAPEVAADLDAAVTLLLAEGGR
ncbi:HAD-IIIA family hydrolase [Capillimicrobium parvum]|uniref:D,D-heptose 1,7-bisphosphate phosphatase n=1 Tax=Capillimicrobium parvum TaxID=2884022 RepID=A0A9E7BZX5_9ACTN|nr:HAD-IIIA family hydrolase [Capillimicrobium parvum]UGS35776.1 Phosphoglycolate phosphatase [Capillimicrobium parvum]